MSTPELGNSLTTEFQQPLPVEGPAASTDLVPTTYQRQIWNKDHGTKLEHHDDLLDADVARRINEHFSVEVYVGTHGLVLQEPRSDDIVGQRRYYLSKPTQLEYAAAAEVVNGMSPGDTLFLEGFGFADPIIKPLSKAALEAADLPLPPISDHMAMFSYIVGQVAKEEIAHMRRETESRRANYEVTAWTHAGELAVLRGVTVVPADMDVFEAKQFERDGKNQHELLYSRNPDEAAYADRVQEIREKRGRNTLKDWAVKHLPPEGTPPPAEGEKPRLVLLFGSGHKENLDAKFKDIGLAATITEMAATQDINERIHEQQMFLVSKVWGQLISPVIEASSSTPRTAAGDRLQQHRREYRQQEARNFRKPTEPDQPSQ